MSRRSVSGLPLLVLVALFLACAEIGAPPGGEEDKKGPVVIRTEPAAGSVNTARTDKIELYFSEPILKPTSGQSLFFSPRQSRPPKINWKSDHIELKLADSLAPNQTYTISLSSGISDLHNNRIDSLAPLAFSTGPALDSGSVNGEVLDDRKGVGGVVVALFDSLPPDSIPFDSTYPQYLTSSNANGKFTLRYLPPKSFYLIAFEDKNNNGLFNPSSERFAIPDRPVSLKDSLSMPPLRLQLTSASPRTKISDVAYTTDDMVRVRFIGPVNARFIATQPANAQVKSLTDSTQIFSAKAVAQSQIDTTRLIDFWFGPLAEGSYVGTLRLDSTAPMLAIDTFAVKKGEDKAIPRIVANTPASGAHFREDVVITFAFSEPIDSTRLQPHSFVLVASESDTIPLVRRWSDPMHLTLLPPDLASGTSYKLTVAPADIVDLHGNPAGDSAQQFSFSTYAPDSVGSASGDVTVAEGKDPSTVRLRFVRVADKQEFSRALDGARFSLPLPAGRYLLSGFYDTNGDGRLFRGSIYPYRLAETMSFYPDTIAVRARFETTGIHFEIR